MILGCEHHTGMGLCSACSAAVARESAEQARRDAARAELDQGYVYYVDADGVVHGDSAYNVAARQARYRTREAAIRAWRDDLERRIATHARELALMQELLAKGPTR